MTTQKLHKDEIDIDESIVKRLLDEQFPQWADLPLERIYSTGTVNAIYRLGESMSVRLPRIPKYVDQLDKELRWLPQMAPCLPLDIPEPLAKGTPNAIYPSFWSVYSWLEGENATLDRIADPNQAAIDLAQFIKALQQIDPTQGPAPGAHNFFRGVPLGTRDASTRDAIAALHGKIDTEAALNVWEASLRSPEWDGLPVWIHGDLHAGNMLAQRGKLSAVIDFGGLGVGDPACDLIVAWHLFGKESRSIFRNALAVDETTWTRGRSWAFSIGLIALPYYWHTNPTHAEMALYTINEVFNDFF